MPHFTHLRPARGLLASLLIALLFPAIAPAPARAAGSVWCVAPTPATTTAPCANGDAITSLQGAINRAQPGDTIHVARGTYTGGSEAVIRIFATSLTIIGGYAPGAWAAPTVDPSLTVIDAQNGRRGALIGGAAVLLANLTIQNGRVGSAGNLQQGGGLLAEQNQNGIIILDTVVVRANQAGGSGGGVAIFGPAEFYDTTLRGNSAGEDGGGFWVGGSLRFDGGLVAENSAARSGGGGSVGACACTSVSYQANTAVRGSGGAVFFSADSRFSASSFRNNRASENGGAIAQQGAGASLSVADSLFVGNLAQVVPGVNVSSPNNGGAIAAFDAISVQRSNFEQNGAQGNGGAIFQQQLSGAVAASDSRFARNSAGNDGGAIALLGAITLSGVELLENTAARDGGGVAQLDPGNGRLPGPGAFSSLLVVGNKATGGDGGGISMAEPFALSGATFTANSAGLSGGGIAMQAPFAIFRTQPVKIASASFSGNQAQGGRGGAAYLAPTAGVELRSTRMVGNTATGSGGGLAQEGGETLALTGVLLAENSAGQSGAALYAANGDFSPLRSVELLNVTVASAEPRTAVAMALPVNTLAVTLTNTVVTSHTTGLGLGTGQPGGAPTIAGDYVGFFGVASPVSGASGPLSFSPPNLVSADPQFRDPRAGDFTLASGSPLIDAGDPGRGYAGQRDADGRLVPAGPRAEIGASEYRTLEPRVYLPAIIRPTPYPTP